jgi:outer membrane biogenesis lipoprotein LolB
MNRLLPLLALVLLAACAGLGTQKISGDENQVVLSAADLQKAQQHCASYGKDAVNLGQSSGSNVTYACRPRRT